MKFSDYLKKSQLEDLIKKHINQHGVDDDPYEVAKEIGLKCKWSDSEIEKAEKIIRKKYIK